MRLVGYHRIQIYVKKNMFAEKTSEASHNVCFGLIGLDVTGTFTMNLV